MAGDDGDHVPLALPLLLLGDRQRQELQESRDLSSFIQVRRYLGVHCERIGGTITFARYPGGRPPVSQ